MKWVLLLLSYALAQPSLSLLPSGVTIDMVKQIRVNIAGTVEFVKSADDSATITNRLAYAPKISFDNTTGILSVDSPVANGSSMLKPGLLTAALLAILCAFNINKQHGTLLLFLCLGMGVAHAASADLTIRVPGCFHIEGANNNVLVFDESCLDTNVSMFMAPPQPVAAIAATNPQWAPVTPATSFYPVNDHGQHYLTPAQQYEIWKQNFGHADDATERQNFYDFTEACRIQNMDLNRSWTAACNQFAHLTNSDWKDMILANNAAAIAAGNTRRRLLSVEDQFSVISDDHKRKLLQSTSFTWLGTGKLTPVKDQGQCGSCYAHATTSQMEAQLAIAKGTVPVPLSREQLKDCASGAQGCNGGTPELMFIYAKQGLTTEANYPYVASAQACRSPAPASAFSDAGYISISNTEAAFKAALANGPIAVTVCASTWSNYAGGVFTNCASQTCEVDHAVLLVGYGIDPTLGSYWLIQNSWNTWWGEAGFIRLPRTDSTASNTGSCGLTRNGGLQAQTPTGSGTTSATDCQGSWSAWSSCSKTCGGGQQTRTWTTTRQPSGGGALCPNPTTVVQTCNAVLCPGGSTSLTCLHVGNSVLGASGDGNYQKATDWNQGFCGTATNPQYTATINGKQLALFFFTTNCVNNLRTAGQWGLGPIAIPRQAYQWSGRVTVTNNVIPPPNSATGWTLQFSAC